MSNLNLYFIPVEKVFPWYNREEMPISEKVDIVEEFVRGIDIHDICINKKVKMKTVIEIIRYYYGLDSR